MEEAILAGLYEVVERDGLMISWYHSLPVPAIDLDSFSSQLMRETLSAFAAAPVHLFCSSLTSDLGIPVVLAAMRTHQKGWPAMTVGTASGLSIEMAASRAFAELAANLQLMRWHLSRPNLRIPRTPDEVESMEDHGLYYSHLDNLSALDQFLHPHAWIRTNDAAFQQPEASDVKTNIEACTRRLADRDLEVIVVDLTTPRIKSEGFCVVKVIVPGTQPIDFGTRWRHLGGTRLQTAPRNMGYANSCIEPSLFNPQPHPFP
jgi:ribosomal protein S12 methylthiotransferase accessory factor